MKRRRFFQLVTGAATAPIVKYNNYTIQGSYGTRHTEQLEELYKRLKEAKITINKIKLIKLYNEQTQET